jgi:protein-tyrosine phosphatase
MTDSSRSTDLATRIAQGERERSHPRGVVPLITQYGNVLSGRVWHGGCTNNVRACTEEGDEFDLIVSLYPREKYSIRASQTARLEMPLLDTGECDLALVRVAADLAAAYLNKGGKVLIHCQEGMNRSSLVLGVLLIEHAGISPQEAIGEIRKRRSKKCLYNGAFVRQLLSLQAT